MFREDLVLAEGLVTEARLIGTQDQKRIDLVIESKVKIETPTTNTSATERR